jgi:hypothetical protein
MPALPNVPGTLKVALSGITNSPLPWLSRFFVNYTGTAPTAAQLTTFNAAVNTAYGADLKSLAGNAITLTQVESIDLTSSTGAVAINTVSTAGTRGTDYLPTQVAHVVSYEIARRYRGGHPRGYWPFGIHTDITSPDDWNSSFLSASLTGFNAFFAAIVAAGWSGAGTLTHCNVSYYEGFTVVTSPTTGRARNIPTTRVTPLIDTVTSIVPRASVGTQRRRGAFVD